MVVVIAAIITDKSRICSIIVIVAAGVVGKTYHVVDIGRHGTKRGEI